MDSLEVHRWRMRYLLFLMFFFRSLFNEGHVANPVIGQLKSVSASMRTSSIKKCGICKCDRPYDRQSGKSLTFACPPQGSLSNTLRVEGRHMLTDNPHKRRGVVVHRTKTFVIIGPQKKKKEKKEKSNESWQGDLSALRWLLASLQSVSFFEKKKSIIK